MKKREDRIVNSLCSMVCVIALGILLVSCGNKGNSNRESFMSKDSSKSDLNPKTENSRKQAVSDGLSFKLSLDGSGYVLDSRGTCTDNEIVVPESYLDLPVIKIESEAFKNDIDLISFTCSSVISIGNNAFSGCVNLVDAIFGDQLTVIGQEAFSFCSKLNEIHFSKNLIKVGQAAFFDSGFVKEMSNYRDGCLYVDDWLVMGNTQCTDLRIDCRGIADGVFANNDFIENVDISKNVVFYGEDMFSFNPSLRSVVMKKSVNPCIFIQKYFEEDITFINEYLTKYVRI